MYRLDLESFESLFLSDSDVGLFQWNGTEAVVKVVEPLSRIDTQEGGHILRGGRQKRDMYV